MRVEVNVTGIDGVLKTLRSLPAEIVSKNGGPVKLALAKGARLFRDYEKQALSAAIALHGEEQSTGLLLDNVVASRGRGLPGGKGEKYLVRIRRKVYPDRKGKPVTTHKTAHLLEYGSSKQPATPFIRPTVQAKGAETIRVITAELSRRLDVIVRKLARQNAR